MVAEAAFWKKMLTGLFCASTQVCQRCIRTLAQATLPWDVTYSVSVRLPAASIWSGILLKHSQASSGCNARWIDVLSAKPEMTH